MQGEICHLEPESEHVDGDRDEERLLACVVDAAPPIGSDLLQRCIDQRFHAGVCAQYWRRRSRTAIPARPLQLGQDWTATANERCAASPPRGLVFVEFWSRALSPHRCSVAQWR